MKDKYARLIVKYENKRQNSTLELIASENFASKEVRRMMSSCLTNKYAEGYPNARYYGGCENIDLIEQLAIDRAKELFKVNFANVQPHSGSQANAAAYKALENYLSEKLTRKSGKKRKMRILTMDLNSGAHLTHGSKVSFSNNDYDFYFFQLNENGELDFNIIEKAIKEYKPDVLLSGYSAYPYEIDFVSFKELADKYRCLFMVDMAHIAGLVAAGEHTNPCHYADIVTTTTHKTLRGPRGGLILTNDELLAKYVDKAVFPYYQGGPLEHVIAAKAVCFAEAMTIEFRDYIKQVKINTSVFADYLKFYGATCTLSANHLMLVNTMESFQMTGLQAQEALEKIGIATNKNMLPNDKESPKYTSGLRIGFAAATTRGLNENQARDLAAIVYCYLRTYNCINARGELNIYKDKVNKIIKTLKRI